jgi:hypothetical protein
MRNLSSLSMPPLMRKLLTCDGHMSHLSRSYRQARGGLPVCVAAAAMHLRGVHPPALRTTRRACLQSSRCAVGSTLWRAATGQAGPPGGVTCAPCTMQLPGSCMVCQTAAWCVQHPMAGHCRAGRATRGGFTWSAAHRAACPRPLPSTVHVADAAECVPASLRADQA